MAERGRAILSSLCGLVTLLGHLLIPYPVPPTPWGGLSTDTSSLSALLGCSVPRPPGSCLRASVFCPRDLLLILCSYWDIPLIWVAVRVVKNPPWFIKPKTPTGFINKWVFPRISVFLNGFLKSTWVFYDNVLNSSNKYFFCIISI